MSSSSGIVKKKNNYGSIYTVKQLSAGAFSLLHAALQRGVSVEPTSHVVVGIP